MQRRTLTRVASQTSTQSQLSLFGLTTRQFDPMALPSEQHLLAAVVHLGAASVPQLSTAEVALMRHTIPLSPELVEQLQHGIATRYDPLGEAFTTIRTPNKGVQAEPRTRRSPSSTPWWLGR